MPGYKKFLDSQILKAESLNDFLMQQAIIVSSSQSERNTTLSSYARAGMVCYTVSDGQINVHDGTNWNRVAKYSEALSGYDPRNNLVSFAMEPREVTVFI